MCSMDPTDTEEVAAALRQIVDAINAGELTATATARRRIEGAAIALETISRPPSE